MIVINPEEIKKKRSAYSYPTISIQGKFPNLSILKFTSTEKMDYYHQSLLLSASDEDVVLGYLGVIFWGFYSGKDGILREERAFSRLKIAYNGGTRIRKNKEIKITGVIDIGIESLAKKIRNALLSIKNNKIDEALEKLMELPQLEIAFASKLCAFLSPQKCGVADSVIASNYPKFNFDVNKTGNIKKNKNNIANYKSYCIFLQKKADEMNLLGKDYYWLDTDGVTKSWRALDIERALY